MSLNLKSLHGLATVMYNAITTKNKPIRDWLESIFSPKSHTHTKSQITDFAHTHTKNQISDFSHTHTAAQVNVTASSVVSADTVQAHIEHLTKNKSNINHTHTVAQITGASNVVTLPDYSSLISSGAYVMEYKASEKCWVSAWNDGELKNEALNFTVNGVLVSYCGGDGRQAKSAFAPLGPGDVLRCIIVAYPPIPRTFNYRAYKMK